MNQQINPQSLHAPAPTPAPAPDTVNVLIACEESQAECIAFRRLGFNAYSCDIQKCAGKHPEWHIMGDVTPLFAKGVRFTTMDGNKHFIDHWDLIVAHPPCTYLCKAGSVHMVQNGFVNPERYKLMMQARQFFYTCLNAPAMYVAVENPLPMRRAGLPKPSCFLHPSWFGVKYTKKTLYWLKNLPPIMPEIEHPHPRCYVTSSRGKYRSRTFPQVADAIARQWGNYILDELHRF